MEKTQEWVRWFRHASPYINSQRNQVLVIALGGDALLHSNLDNIVHDISLLNSLGVRLVLVFGARPQIDSILEKNKISSRFHHNLRVTEDHIIQHVLEAYGRVRSELEAKLSMGVINSPMHGAKLKVVSGNYVMAKPYGVMDGVDLGLTGNVRSIDSISIHRHLDEGSVVLISSTGYSISGDIFNLGYEELASDVAVKLCADKIIYFGEHNGVKDCNGQLIPQLTVKAAQALASKHQSRYSQQQYNQLFSSAKACDSGVNRAHIISFVHDGALLKELFTRDGNGTMVSVDEFDQVRPACPEDTNGILNLIQPLEEQGFLVRRSRERLETELDYFLVEVRDNAIIACVGLYPFPNEQSGELSCFAVDPEYRQKGRGDRLLRAVEERAKNQNLLKLFVLTTKTEQWFKERGFNLIAQGSLPGDKSYNTNRNAKVLMKHIN